MKNVPANCETICEELLGSKSVHEEMPPVIMILFSLSIAMSVEIFGPGAAKQYAQIKLPVGLYLAM